MITYVYEVAVVATLIRTATIIDVFTETNTYTYLLRGNLY